MTLGSSSFDSYSRNGEDVVLWRALRGIADGRYIDVGENHSEDFSVSRAFYERGWSGITVEPDPELARLQREQRPRDVLVEAPITASDGTAPATYRLDQLLKEAGWSGRDIQFMSVDMKGSEREVLESIDLSAWRPWILIIRAPLPLSRESSPWEPLVAESGYEFCLFDGLSCWYVAREHRARLGAAPNYSASVVDDYSTIQSRKQGARIEHLQAALDDLLADTVRWRTEALTRWSAILADKLLVANAQADLETTERQLQDLQHAHLELQREHHELNQLSHQLGQQNAGLHEQLIELHKSTSWRVTKPLRSTIGRIDRLRNRR